MAITIFKQAALRGIFAVLFFSSYTLAQDGKMYPIKAPSEVNAISLNTGGVKNQDAAESWFRQWGDPMARNISHATLTPFLADPKTARGTSVIVAPGGGYMWLSMGNEGWEVAEALAAQGINAFVLKYRLQPTAEGLSEFEGQMNRRFDEVENKEKPSRSRKPDWDLSDQLEDVEAAYKLIVKNAKKWNVDLERMGMLGFSAGAGLTVATTLQSKKVKLAFIAPIYGGMWAVDVPKKAPAMFIAVAVDDFLFNGKFGLIESWYRAGVPVEFHLYQNGGHGFGLGNPNRTSNKWFQSFIYWLKVNKFIENEELSTN